MTQEQKMERNVRKTQTEIKHGITEHKDVDQIQHRINTDENALSDSTWKVFGEEDVPVEILREIRKMNSKVICMVSM